MDEQENHKRRLDVYFNSLTVKTDGKITKMHDNIRLLKQDLEATTKIIEKRA